MGLLKHELQNKLKIDREKGTEIIENGCKAIQERDVWLSRCKVEPFEDDLELVELAKSVEGTKLDLDRIMPDELPLYMLEPGFDDCTPEEKAYILAKHTSIVLPDDTSCDEISIPQGLLSEMVESENNREINIHDLVDECVTIDQETKNSENQILTRIEDVFG